MLRMLHWFSKGCNGSADQAAIVHFLDDNRNFAGFQQVVEFLPEQVTKTGEFAELRAFNDHGANLPRRAAADYRTGGQHTAGLTHHMAGIQG